MSGIIPAAFAFGAVGAIDFDGQAGQSFGWGGGRDRGRMDFDLGNDEERGEERFFFLEQFL